MNKKCIDLTEKERVLSEKTLSTNLSKNKGIQNEWNRPVQKKMKFPLKKEGKHLGPKKRNHPKEKKFPVLKECKVSVKKEMHPPIQKESKLPFQKEIPLKAQNESKPHVQKESNPCVGKTFFPLLTNKAKPQGFSFKSIPSSVSEGLKKKSFSKESSNPSQKLNATIEKKKSFFSKKKHGAKKDFSKEKKPKDNFLKKNKKELSIEKKEIGFQIENLYPFFFFGMGISRKEKKFFWRQQNLYWIKIYKNLRNQYIQKINQPI